VNKWIYNSLSKIWPTTCLLCAGRAQPPHDTICSSCRDDLKVAQHACRHCAIPLVTQGDLICGDCQQTKPIFDTAYSYAAYKPPLDRLIQQFKFHQNLSVGRTLGILMARDIQQRGLDKPDVLLPVPLHPLRLRQRGYNQALEMARPVAANLKLPLDFTSCRRQKMTTEQSGLNANSRISNIKNAFNIGANFQGKRVAIIDDVMTTGSTVNELSSQLKKAGAERVDVWVFARAVL